MRAPPLAVTGKQEDTGSAQDRAHIGPPAHRLRIGPGSTPKSAPSHPPQVGQYRLTIDPRSPPGLAERHLRSTPPRPQSAQHRSWVDPRPALGRPPIPTGSSRNPIWIRLTRPTNCAAVAPLIGAIGHSDGATCMPTITSTPHDAPVIHSARGRLHRPAARHFPVHSAPTSARCKGLVPWRADMVHSADTMLRAQPLRDA